jgi:hypothetical protein
VVQDKAAAEEEDEDVEEDNNHDNKDNYTDLMLEQAEESDANQVVFVAAGHVVPVIYDEKDGRNGSKKEVVKKLLQINLCDDDDGDDNDDDDKDKGKESEETAVVHNAIAPEQLEKNSSSVEDDNEEDKNGIMEEEEHTPGQDSDHSWQILAKACTGRHVPTSSKQTKLAVCQLCTNGLDLPKCNRPHKAQHPVAPDAPGFLEASDTLVFPPTLKHLCNNCLIPTKEAFLISATAHVHVILQACGLA